MNLSHAKTKIHQPSETIVHLSYASYKSYIITYNLWSINHAPKLITGHFYENLQKCPK